jgi:hypothetical protein
MSIYYDSNYSFYSNLFAYSCYSLETEVVLYELFFFALTLLLDVDDYNPY